MEWGTINAVLAREHQRPGCCISCDTPLPIKPTSAKGRPRTLLCGDAECLRTYHLMRKSLVREMTTKGVRDELQQAAARIRRANEALKRLATRDVQMEAGHA